MIEIPRLPFPRVIDSTIRGAFATCPQKFYYEFIRRIGPKRLSIHLHFGATFARGLEVFRREFYPKANISNYKGVEQRALGMAFEAMIIEWGDYPPDSGDAKTLWRCLGALDFYFETHPPYSDVIQPFYKADKTPAVEFSFALPLEDCLHPETGEPILYAGRFDMLGLYDEEILYVVDEKTTSSLGPTWSSSWDLRAQFIGYVWASKSYGYPVAGAIARGISILKTKYDYADALVPISDWLIQKWRKQLTRDIHRMIALWEKGEYDSNYDSSCTSYGGCPFKSLCLTPYPERWIDNDFAPRDWDPLSLDPLKEARMKEEPLIGILMGEE